MSESIRIVGLDLSLTATGFCDWAGETQTLSSPMTAMERIRDLMGQVNERVIYYGEGGWPVTAPDLIVIEDYAFSRGGHAHEIGELGGVVKSHLMDLSLAYLLIGPSALKKFATDNGQANKIKMAVAASKLGREFADDNQCDAWWLREIALYRYGAGATAPKTAYRDEVVSKITWPELGTKVCSG